LWEVDGVEVFEGFEEGEAGLVGRRGTGRAEWKVEVEVWLSIRGMVKRAM
jgi:hypothetical protein